MNIEKKISEITHPNRRGLLKMVGWLLIQPNTAIAGVKDKIWSILWKYDDDVFRSVLKDLVAKYAKHPQNLDLVSERTWIAIESFTEESLADLAMRCSEREVWFLEKYTSFLQTLSSRYDLDLDGSWIDQVCPVNFEWYIHGIFSWWTTRGFLHDIFISWSRDGIEFIFQSNGSQIMVAPSVLEWFWRNSYLRFDDFDTAVDFFDRPMDELVRDLERHKSDSSEENISHHEKPFYAFLKNTTSLTPVESYRQQRWDIVWDILS